LSLLLAHPTSADSGSAVIFYCWLGTHHFNVEIPAQF